MNELQRLRDNFASKLAKQVNDTVLRFAMQLSFVMHAQNAAPGDNASERGSQISLSQALPGPGVRSSSELYKVQRNELLQLAPLVGGWLQVNRPDIYAELKKVSPSDLVDCYSRSHVFFKLFLFFPLAV
ncbi:unnamed protein product [Echinostoma caproni]|uniref:Dynamin_M domain-containing protein n=1 Tax=Echinostoma caproni TaxID=27848 RepID=A0A183BFA3_9TREM|nr:unnamed protein product [Echinostoma caproni]